MKVSPRWLAEYVDLDLSVTELARRLTETLAEAEVVGAPTSGVRGVLTARIGTVEPHPKADSLTVCTVDWGEGTGTVVCGAPNAREGLVSALAVPGTTIAGGRRVEEQTIRGVSSAGMLVSAAELGVEDCSEGILELPGDTALGCDVAELLGLDEELIELDVAANRPDCSGLIGVAREVAAMTGRNVRHPAISISEGGEKTADLVAVRTDDAAACPRYVARVLRGVTVGESPPWLKARLRSVGVRSVNNVVDATNYVLFEFGQPIHAFDYDKLDAKEIVVRRATKGEAIVTLDGEERTLGETHLLICDGPKPVALAGIMGGLETEVSESTTDILIECAWFDPVIVRRGARALSLRTEASQRFERGVDPTAIETVAERACQLIAALAGGTVAKGAVDVFTGTVSEKTIRVRPSAVGNMLGSGLDEAAARNSLARLGFVVRDGGSDEGAFTVAVPSYRLDVETEADVIEEIARARGYDKIAPELPYHEMTAVPDEERELTSGLRNTMVGLGFLEVLSTSFVGAGGLSRLGLYSGHPEVIELANPINKETPYMRVSVLPSLLDIVERNARVGERDVRLFELGKVFRREDGFLTERWKLAGAMTGIAEPAAWDRSPRMLDFYDGKGIISLLADSLRVDNHRAACYDGVLLDPTVAASLITDGGAIGEYGMLSKSAMDAWDLSGAVFVFEIDLLGLKDGRTRGRGPEAPSRFPSSGRDISLVLDEATPAGDVLDAMASLGQDLLKRIDVFDVYRGDQLAPGKKSLGLSLTYSSSERTLTDKEVDEVHERIVSHLLAEFDATLRR